MRQDSLSGDKLYQNELDSERQGLLHRGDYKAGIYNSQIGYGLGVGVSDLNLDGYLDIYVSNDFNENDYLYINQGRRDFQAEPWKNQYLIPADFQWAMILQTLIMTD